MAPSTQELEPPAIPGRFSVPQNYIKAYAWWSMAAAQGKEMASDNKDIVTEKMTSQQIAEGQAYATRCFENDYRGCD